MEDLSFDVFLAADAEDPLADVEDALVSEHLTFLRAPLLSDWTRLTRALEPCAVVVDLRSGAASGLAAVGQLRRLSIPVLVLAGDRAAFDAALDLGVAALLEPFHPGDVIAVLLDLVTAEVRKRAMRPEEDELVDDVSALEAWTTKFPLS